MSWGHLQNIFWDTIANSDPTYEELCSLRSSRLSLAAYHKMSHVVRYLIESKIEANLDDNEYGTILKTGILRGEVAIIQMLLQNITADIFCSGDTEGNSVRIIIERRHHRVVDMVVTIVRGANPTDGFGYGVGFLSKRARETKTVRFLLDRCRGRIFQDSRNYTLEEVGPSILGSDDEASIFLLISCGEEINETGKEVLLEKMEEGNLEVVKFILNMGFDINNYSIENGYNEGHPLVVASGLFLLRR
ncbi:hypothetical protein F4774DRAFT_219503 [Daldinia eschscholtzii]|nr:hypothetical protein F4774DRAFT_219503 [Daldinia eschscholtzii]